MIITEKNLQEVNNLRRTLRMQEKRTRAQKKVRKKTERLRSQTHQVNVSVESKSIQNKISTRDILNSLKDIDTSYENLDSDVQHDSPGETDALSDLSNFQLRDRDRITKSGRRSVVSRVVSNDLFSVPMPLENLREIYVRDKRNGTLMTIDNSESAHQELNRDGKAIASELITFLRSDEFPDKYCRNDDVARMGDLFGSLVNQLWTGSDIAHAAAMSLGMSLRYLRNSSDNTSREQMIFVFKRIGDLCDLRDSLLINILALTFSETTFFNEDPGVRTVLYQLISGAKQLICAHDKYKHIIPCLSVSTDASPIQEKVEAIVTEVFTKVPVVENILLNMSPLLARLVRSNDLNQLWARYRRTFLQENTVEKRVLAAVKLFIGYMTDKMSVYDLTAGIDPSVLVPTSSAENTRMLLVAAYSYKTSKSDDTLMETGRLDSYVFSRLFKDTYASDGMVTVFSQILSDMISSDYIFLEEILMYMKSSDNIFDDEDHFLRQNNMLTWDVRHKFTSGASRFCEHTAVIDGWYKGVGSLMTSISNVYEGVFTPRRKVIQQVNCMDVMKGSLIRKNSPVLKNRRPILYDPVSWKDIYIKTT